MKEMSNAVAGSAALQSGRIPATTLHMWTQIVGKIRLTLSPWTNHSWHVTLYVTSRGLTTSPIPHGTSTFEIRFDFIDHELQHRQERWRSDESIELRAQSVADFYREVMNDARRASICR